MVQNLTEIRGTYTSKAILNLHLAWLHSAILNISTENVCDGSGEITAVAVIFHVSIQEGKQSEALSVIDQELKKLSSKNTTFGSQLKLSI